MENQGSKRGKTMFSFFKPSEQTSTSKGYYSSNVDVSNCNDHPPFKSQRVEIDVNTLERDPRIRIPRGNILLIKKMKLEELISKWVYNNLS
jgi:hypothetical protein